MIYLEKVCSALLYPKVLTVTTVTTRHIGRISACNFRNFLNCSGDELELKLMWSAFTEAVVLFFASSGTN